MKEWNGAMGNFPRISKLFIETEFALDISAQIAHGALDTTQWANEED